MSGRAGWTLPEVILSILLLGVLSSVALGSVLTHQRAMGALMRQAEVDEAARVVRWILRDELTQGVAGPGAPRVAPDSLILRGYRAVARPCNDVPGGPIESRGIRRADPARDSVQLLGVDGRWRSAQLVEVAGAPRPCGASGAGESWRISPLPPVPTVYLRLHERAGYHLADRALRLRRSGGRQPLTPELLRHPGSGFLPERGGVRVLLRLPGNEVREAWFPLHAPHPVLPPSSPAP